MRTGGLCRSVQEGLDEDDFVLSVPVGPRVAISIRIFVSVVAYQRADQSARHFFLLSNNLEPIRRHFPLSIDNASFSCALSNAAVRYAYPLPKPSGQPHGGKVHDNRQELKHNILRNSFHHAKRFALNGAPVPR